MLFPTTLQNLFTSGEPNAIRYDKIHVLGNTTVEEISVYTGSIEDSVLWTYGEVARPEWDSASLLLMPFENNFDAGNFPTNDNPVTHWNILRREYGESQFTIIDTVPNDGYNAYYDISATNDTQYEYAIQSVSNGKRGDAVISEVIKVSFYGWRLTSLDYNELAQTGTNYSFIVMNETDAITMNRARTVYNNTFATFPTIEYGASKYRTGGMTTMPFTCTNGVYTFGTNQTREDLEAFLLNGEPKYLKNGSGLNMIVDIEEYSIKYLDEVNNGQFATNENEQPFTISFSFIEIAQA